MSTDDAWKRIIFGSPMRSEQFQTKPQPTLRSLMYAFPRATLGPGVEETYKVQVKGLFRAEKLVMAGTMDEIRGYYRIRHTRMPWLNRDDVIASTRVYRCRRGKKVWFRKGRTMIEFAGSGRDEYQYNEVKNFKRTYLPSSVVFRDVDPLEYIRLLQLQCGKEEVMPSSGEGAIGSFFGASSLGNGFPAPATDAIVSIRLKNTGDIQVRVAATILGRGYSDEAAQT